MNELNKSVPIDLRDIARTLARRKWLLIIPWSVALVGGLLAAFLLPPVYLSSVVLMLERPQQLTGNLGGVVSGGSNADAQADMMREQVKSSLFLNSVLASTGVRNDPATRKWALKSAKKYPGLSENEVIDLFLTGYLRDAVSIQRARGNVFKIGVEDNDRDRARKLAGGIADQFVLSSKAQQLEAVRRTQEFSVEEQQVFKRRLDESEAQLEAFRRRALTSSVRGSSVGAANLQNARMLLDRAGFEAEEMRQRLSSMRSRMQGKVHENDPQQLSSPQANAIMAQITGLERELASAQLSETGVENAGSVRLAIARKNTELEAELTAIAAHVFPTLPAEVREQLVSYRSLQADLAGVDARRQWLSEQVNAYESSVVMAPNVEMDQLRLQQQVENDRALYNSFLQQSTIAQIAEAFENAKVSGKFVVLEPATRPLAPSKPNRPVLILLSLMAGAIVGAGTVLVVEQHDHSVKNAEEVESLLGLPVLGTVPRVAELERSRRRHRSPAQVAGVPAPRDHGLLHRLKVESPLGLEFRRTYLKLVRDRSRRFPRSLMTTSATRGEGKTTTTACLAITIARELREKVLLVDFDLRSPALHRALGLPSSSWGLAQMLHQRHFDERFVRATVLPNLEFLPAGKSERPASELVDTEGVEWFLKEATSRYPMVIVDAPPNLAVPDPLIIGRAVEGVLYVVKAGSTIRKAAEYGVKVQREACDNVLGVLINDSGEVLPHYYGYRYNYYGYASEAAGTDS